MSASTEKRTLDGSGDSTQKKQKSTLAVNLDEKLIAAKSQLRDAFRQSNSANINGIEVVSEPFKCVIIPDFIQDQGFLKELKNELDHEIDYIPKNNDLYRFRQSDDFKKIKLPNVTALRQFFLTKVRSFLTEVTGIELFEDVVDLTASKYEYNGELGRSG